MLFSGTGGKILHPLNIIIFGNKWHRELVEWYPKDRNKDISLQ
jgi:hypothetical protein